MFIQTQLFIFLLGSVAIRAFAEEASTVPLEDETVSNDFKDRNDSELEERPTLLPTRLHNITDLLPLEDLMTTESAVATNEDDEISTDPDVVENSEDEVGEEPETTEEKEGLSALALVGIIAGIIIAVGIVAGIIIAVVRKMSGRYSP
ncbi:podoplanin isoform X1 [Pelodiscus sinensis]|uniref:podoplanin isoform X1 n=2 Tax=Pelodiscus sinensis TaxID=13735 RepID=UPI0003C45392|nr:podoplanin isoform X1 [Pelodiscus sinensis]|eukprot:XP_014431380.1 podoplanin isoform X1 [Pelodiscus sinensis]